MSKTASILSLLFLVGALSWGCDEQLEALPQTLTIDALGQTGRACELDKERSSAKELHWRCAAQLTADGTAGGGEVSFEGSGGTHWSCIDLGGFEGSGGTHWFCSEGAPGNGLQTWDCVETTTGAPVSDWTCVPSSLPLEQQICTAVSQPPLDLWTNEFAYPLDWALCANGSGVQQNSALYLGRVDRVSGNRADLSFMKTDGEGPPSEDINYWVLALNAETFVCSGERLEDLPVRASGVWRGGSDLLQLTDVPIWKDDATYAAAPVGAFQTLALVTGGVEGPTARRWFQLEPFVFSRACLP